MPRGFVFASWSVLCLRRKNAGVRRINPFMDMRKYVGFACLLGLSALLVSGCRYGSHGDEDASVRLINAVPDGGGLNVSVDGQRVWKRSLFRSNTGYQGLSAGNYPVRMEAADAGTTLMVRPLLFEKGHAYTVLALGQVRSGGRPAEVEVLEDDARRGKEVGKATVRFINAALGLTPLDLVVNNIVGLNSVSYGRRSQALMLEGGSYDLTIVAADTPDSLVSPVTVHLESGHSYTLVAMGRVADQSLSLEAYPDAP